MTADDPRKLAAAFLAQGEEAHARGEEELAWGWLQKAITLARTHGEHRTLAAAGRRLAALCARREEQGVLALALATEARQAAEAAWSRPDIAACDALLGRLRIQQGEVEAGLRSLHLAVDMWGELGLVDPQLDCWRQIGAAHARLGELDAAQVAWGRCLAVLQHRRDLAAQADLHAEVARACGQGGRIDLAITHALAALGRHRHLDHPAVSDDLACLLMLRGSLGGAPFREAISHHLDDDAAQLVEALMDDEDLRRNPPPPPPPPPPAPPTPPSPPTVPQRVIAAATEEHLPWESAPAPAPDAAPAPEAGEGEREEEVWDLPEGARAVVGGERSLGLRLVEGLWGVLLVLFGLLVVALVVGGLLNR